MYVKCKVLRMIYEGNDDYKVLSCRPLDHIEKLPIHPIYQTIALAGSNLSMLKIGDTYTLDIQPSTNGKYANSVSMIGVPNMVLRGDKISIKTSQEIGVLQQYMTKRQADNIHKAYPNFVQNVLDGKTAEDFDVKKIKNVKNVRIKEYVKKINQNKDIVLLTPCAMRYGITLDADIQKIAATFETANNFNGAMEENPYNVFINILGHSFQYADGRILKKQRSLIDSKMRCEAACIDVLKQNEVDGNTRMSANDLARAVYIIAPECYAHCSVVVLNNSFHYDNEHKWVSLLNTWKASCNIAKNVLERVNNPIFTQMETVDVDATLTEQQRKLLNLAQEESIMMLIGYSGTGKSYTTKALVELLDNNNLSYQLLAPTGTASKVLTKYTGRKAQTIHKFILNNNNFNYDYIIVDEASMIGEHLLSNLFDLIPISTKIIFICDNAQLASISCGNIVTDIINSGKVKIAELTKVFRYKTSGLATIATDIRNGETTSLESEYSDYHYLPINHHSLKQILDIYTSALCEYGKEDIMILSPYNKGDFGSRAINLAIQDKFNPNEYTSISYHTADGDVHFKIGDIVLNIKNNYSMPLYDADEEDATCFIANGNRGIVIGEESDEDYQSLIVQFDDNIVVYDKENITNLTLGYAESCHKAQGGQAKVVIVVLDESHSNLLTRNLIYVACTRSVEQLYLIADKLAVERGVMIEEQRRRDTWLYNLLTNQIKYDII